MLIDDNVFMRLRDAHEEYCLLDEASVLVIDLISKAEINR
ncbi:hypothetical protein J2X66_005893 [Pseudomonas sp. 3296]|nr:hypothetical protein [Pseudomonas sp. 3296]